MNKEYLIKYILKNDVKANKEKLETFSLGALVMLVVNLESKLLRKNGYVTKTNKD